MPQHFAGKVWIGNGIRLGSGVTRRGVETTPQYNQRLINPVAASATAVAAAQTVVGGTNMTINGTLASDGIATMDYRRVVTVTSDDDDSGVNFLIHGTLDGRAVQHRIEGVNATTETSTLALDTVTNVTPDANGTGNISVGIGNAFGLDHRLASPADFVAVSEDGILATGGNLAVTAGLASDATSTVNTSDPRGLVTPDAPPNGTRDYSLVYFVDEIGTEAEIFGVEPYTG